jgi:hypothetical protein
MFTAPTGKLVIPMGVGSAGDGRGLMMPRRKRTREQDRRNRISSERRINEAQIAEQHRKPRARLAANDEPPPF